jgi:hypothetical protein
MGALLPFVPGVVAVAGSCSLPPEASVVVSAAARELVAGGCSIVVGCCAGADAAVLAALAGAGGCAARAPLRVLAAFGPVSPPWPAAHYTAPGVSRDYSAVAAVADALLAGADVRWWVGGGPSVPLRARLSRRTRAVVAEASALVVFPASPTVAGSGSWLAASAAADRGLPVIAFPLGFPAAALPELGAGAWVPVGSAGVCLALDGGCQRWGCLISRRLLWLKELSISSTLMSLSEIVRMRAAWPNTILAMPSI